MIRILVVEDDRELNLLTCSVLRQAGYDVIGCLRAVEALDQLSVQIVDLIVSDIMMPLMDGFEFASMVRALNKTIPILFVTAKDDINSKQKGFHLGIDDYMVKPIDMEELVMRVRALLRRANIATEKKLRAGRFMMDADEHTAYLNDVEIPFTVREFNILFKLLSYPKRTFTRSQLMDEFWGLETGSTLRTVDVYINKLREKMTNCDDFEILTVHGLGYKAVIKNDAAAR